MFNIFGCKPACPLAPAILWAVHSVVTLTWEIQISILEVTYVGFGKKNSTLTIVRSNIVHCLYNLCLFLIWCTEDARIHEACYLTYADF